MAIHSNPMTSDARRCSLLRSQKVVDRSAAGRTTVDLLLCQDTLRVSRIGRSIRIGVSLVDQYIEALAQFSDS